MFWSPFTFFTSSLLNVCLVLCSLQDLFELFIILFILKETSDNHIRFDTSRTFNKPPVIWSVRHQRFLLCAPTEKIHHHFSPTETTIDQNALQPRGKVGFVGRFWLLLFPLKEKPQQGGITVNQMKAVFLFSLFKRHSGKCMTFNRGMKKKNQGRVVWHKDLIHFLPHEHSGIIQGACKCHVNAAKSNTHTHEGTTTAHMESSMCVCTQAEHTHAWGTCKYKHKCCGAAVAS